MAIERDDAVRELPGLRFRPGPDERQDALAVGVVPQLESLRCRTRPRTDRPDAGSRSSRRESYVWSLGRDLKELNYSRLPPDLPAGRGRRGRLAVGGPRRLRRVDFVGPPILAEGKLFIAAKSAMNPKQQQAAAAVRAGDPAARRQGALEDRGRRRSGKASDTTTTMRPTTSPSRGWSYRGGGGLHRHARRRPRRGSTPIRAHSTGASATRPSRSGDGPVLLLSSRRNRRPPRPAAPLARRSLLIKGVKSSQFCAIDPDRMKVALGPADREVGAAARRRRAGCVPRRPRDRRTRPEDAASSDGRPGSPAAAWTGGCWCGRTGSGS